jgi:hypothetical protein
MNRGKPWPGFEVLGDNTRSVDNGHFKIQE